MLAETRYFGYLDGDGRAIVTWPGGLLARVTSSRVSRHGFCGELVHFRAVAIDGARWYGTSPGPGMYARLRRAKN